MQTLKRFGDDPEAAELREIKKNHIKSANTLSDNIQRMGGTPDKDSGVWGTFAKTVQGSAKLLGENAALAALKQGEKHGESLYKSALDDNNVLPDCKMMIKNELLPRQIQHINQIETLLQEN